MKGTPSSWTDDRTAELKRRWAAGESASLIATVLKVGRNSVIGKADRLGLSRSKEAAQQASKINNARNASGGGRAVLAYATKVARAIVAGRGTVLEGSTDSKELGVTFRCIPATAATLVDLDHGHCKMPVGDLMAFNGADQLFCGAKTRRDKLSPTGARTFQTYCPTHLDAAHKPLPGGGRPSEKQIVRELRRHI